jgi:hypothetical protein
LRYKRTCDHLGVGQFGVSYNLTYTRIIYLNTDPGKVARRVETDTQRKRFVTSVEDLQEWLDQERGIFFTTLLSNTSSPAHITTVKLKKMLKDFKQPTEECRNSLLSRNLCAEHESSVFQRTRSHMSKATRPMAIASTTIQTHSSSRSCASANPGPRV